MCKYSWGVSSTPISRCKPTQCHNGKRVMVDCPQNSPCFQELPAMVAWLSLISFFVDSCWVLVGQHTAAGSGWHWVMSPCASEPCHTIERKPCCLAVAARPWTLCWKGHGHLTAKCYRRSLAKNKWKKNPKLKPARGINLISMCFCHCLFWYSPALCTCYYKWGLGLLLCHKLSFFLWEM